MSSITSRPVVSALTLVLVSLAGVATASQEIAEREELECAVCHDDPEGERLTDQGRYYGLMETLEGYDQVIAKFGSCNYCHIPDVGSNSLTREGFRFRWMMEDMTGLKRWLDENHPERQSQADGDDGDQSP